VSNGTQKFGLPLREQFKIGKLLRTDEGALLRFVIIHNTKQKGDESPYFFRGSAQPAGSRAIMGRLEGVVAFFHDVFDEMSHKRPENAFSGKDLIWGNEPRLEAAHSELASKKGTKVS